MTYAAAKLVRDEIEARIDAVSATLQSAPRGAMGLTLDSAKTPAWRAAKSEFDRLFAELRAFNAVFTKQYAREIREERSARYACREAA